MHRRAFAAAVLTAPAWVAAQERAAPPEVLAEIPGARLQGGGRFRYFGFHVYDIWLYTGPLRVGTDWAGVPLALDIQYARAFDAKSIATRSLDEMRRLAEVGSGVGERWLGAMKEAFPDVQPGDRITGLQRPGEAARFHANGKFRSEVRDAEFTRLFFGIWLSPRTSEPALRTALLGSPP